jgi:hypothetical protein
MQYVGWHYRDESWSELCIKTQSVPRSKQLRLGYKNQSVNAV